jgi:hypothetical protein
MQRLVGVRELGVRRTPLLVVVAILCVGCGLAPLPPATLAPTPTPAVSMAQLDEDVVRALVLAEAEGVLTKNIDQTMAYWLSDGFVADARHTPDKQDDDLVWKGQYAIRDRYITLVFPGNAQFVQPEILAVQIDGETAVITSTTHIGSEVSIAGDRWTFRKLPEGWRIESLTYNLEPK